MNIDASLTKIMAIITITCQKTFCHKILVLVLYVYIEIISTYRPLRT